MAKNKFNTIAKICAVILTVIAILCIIITKVTVSAAEIELCEHEYEETNFDATCTEMGYTLYTCKICGDSYKDNYP